MRQRQRNGRTGARAREGYTLIEMIFATSILLVLAGMLLQSLLGLRHATASGGAGARVQDRGQRAMERIIEDLRISGFIDQAGALPDYPYLFVDGNADPRFMVHRHLAAAKQAQQSEYDFGANTEIVFRLPDDADGDGVPDVDANGQLVWDPREFSYVVVTNANGQNELQRRIDGGTPEIVTRNIERIVFSDRVTSGFVPLGSIGVQIFFREPDDDGVVHRFSLQAVVRLRNSESLVG